MCGGLYGVHDVWVLRFRVWGWGFRDMGFRVWGLAEDRSRIEEVGGVTVPHEVSATFGVMTLLTAYRTARAG